MSFTKIHPTIHSLKLNPRKITQRLFLIIFLLLTANTINVILQHTRPLENWILDSIDKFFNVNNEANIPTFYSAFLLLFAALVAYVTFHQAKVSSSIKQARPWQVLAGLFVFVALDEIVQIHEFTSNFIRPWLKSDLSGLLYWSWVIPYFLLFLGVAAYLFRFVLNLPAYTRNIIILSGFIYVSGAIGLELLEGHFYKLYSLNHKYNELLYCLEEGMEMIGVTTFIYALLDHLNFLGFRITVTTEDYSSKI
ncbi:multidrug transporter [Adhaeribacter swui]|uniref:Multidrug transporter n=1 Tax=Adhaeribacter swui TaxID=2086471 RepID=A0A7G7GBA0_9BACT|nr:multidrug transporter [Adhaeribacter swui]QNF34434.1 multidrug transporter [Adhaeribacter swui]